MRRYVVSLALVLSALFNSPAYCSQNQVVDKELNSYFNKIASAIYKAEGGAKTRHPYGILKKYKKTSPRQACLNTIRSKYKAWKAINGPKKPFLEYLASKYCPVGADNDPTGLNVNWLRNVSFYMNRV